ncbi:MAG: hypothetical protein IPN76_16200 [Saprospiraceae bacterium]|nr:hypothetical protein [Saprospiraceae bacterium]
MNIKTKLYILFSLLALLGTVILYVLEFQWFQNYLGAKKLVLGAILAGLAVGILLGYLLRKKAKEQVEKMQLWAVCIILPVLLMPLFASLANRLFAEQPKPTKFEFWEEKAYLMSRFGQIKGERPEPSGFYVFVIKNGEMVRLESEKPVFPNAQKGDSVELLVRNGLFGVEFVDW